MYPKIPFLRKNPTQKFILQDFMLTISARNSKTGENHKFCISRMIFMPFSQFSARKIKFSNFSYINHVQYEEECTL